LRVLVRLLRDGADCAQVTASLVRRRREPSPTARAGHEYAIPATGTVKYDCCSATGEP